MPRPKTDGASEAEPTFEQAMNELDEIVHVLEDSSLPLEQLVEKYERGAGLLRICQQRLNTAQQRIELITRNAAGGVELEPVAAVSVSATSATTRSARKTSSSENANSDEIRLF